MHNAGYEALGLAYTYVPFAVEDLVAALGAMRALGIRGLGISMPFKQQILALLDALEPVAARIGAVNTVVNEAGRLVGYNTDWSGAMLALDEALPLRDKRVLVLGAGGAARAVGYGLVQGGARLTLCNRTEARGRELAVELGAEWLAWARRADARIDAVVNATSLGMSSAPGTAPTESPWPEDALHDELVVMDLVYEPIDTPLLRSARRRGARAVHGGRMLLHQAARQFELYTGCVAPLEAMERALERAMATKPQAGS